MAEGDFQVIEVPGMGQVRFPAGMSDAEIGAAIKKQMAAQPETSTVSDMAASALSAPGRAVTGLMGLPRLASDLYRAGQDKVQASGAPSWLKSTAAALDYVPANWMLKNAYSKLPSTSGIRDAVSDVPVVNALTGYEPTTTAGRYTQGIGEGIFMGLPFGAPGMIAGGLSGLGGEAGADVGGALGYPTIGRLAGSTLGFAPALWELALGNRGAQLAREFSQGVTPQQWEQGALRQQQAAAQGAPLTAPEAMATPGLLALQRSVESNPASTNWMLEWLRGRQAQTRAGADRLLDTMGPRPADPAMTAQRVRDSAEGALATERRAINARAAPDYQAADATHVDSSTWNSLVSDAAMARALQAVKREPLLGLENEAEGSMRWIDAAKKYLDAAAKPSVAATPLENTAAAGATQATNRVLPVVDSAVPAYGRARATVEAGRAATLEPLEAGPLGKLVESPTTSAQFNALTDPAADVTPVLASEAARRLRMNDQQTYREMVRNALEVRLDAAFGAKADNTLRGGENFYKAMFETPGTADNVRALLRELPDGAMRARAFDNFMETLRSQANRLPGNSATAEKGLVNQAMDPNGLIRFLKKPVDTSMDLVGRLFGGNANVDLAQVFTGPDGVRELRRLAAMRPGTPAAAAASASLLGVYEQTGTGKR